MYQDLRQLFMNLMLIQKEQNLIDFSNRNYQINEQAQLKLLANGFQEVYPSNLLVFRRLLNIKYKFERKNQFFSVEKIKIDVNQNIL